MNNGIYAALLTMFDENGIPSKKGISEITEHVISKCGVDGLYVAGSTGENFLMSHSQKKTVLETVAKAANKRVTLIAHIGSNVTEEVYELADLAADCGYDAVSAVTPFYYKFTNEEVVDYYLRIAERSKLPLIVYNIPSYTSINLKLSDFEKLFAHGNIKGLKNSAQDYYMLERIRTDFPDIKIFSGVDEALLSAAVLGTDGAIGSTYNVIGHWGKELFKLVSEGKLIEAKTMQVKMNNVIELMLKSGIYQTLKEILALYGVSGCGCRRPFAETTEAQKTAAKHIFDIIEK